MANYGIVRLDNVRSVTNGHLFSLKHEGMDIDNGSVVVKGELYDGEREVRKAVVPTADDVTKSSATLVAAPEVNYEEYRTVDGALEAFTNVKGKPFRSYSLVQDDVFSVSFDRIDAIGAEPAKGNFIVLQAGSTKFKEVATVTDEKFVGKVADIEQLGTSLYMGDAGQIGRINKLAVIEVVSN